MKTSLILVIGFIIVLVLIIFIKKEINSLNQLKNDRYNLELNTKKLLQEVDSLNVLLSNEVVFRQNREAKIDSLDERIATKEAETIILKQELKKIKGKYKDYSNDSLYKELFKVYYLTDSTATIK